VDRENFLFAFRSVFGVVTSSFLSNLNVVLGIVMLILNIAILAPVAWQKYFNNKNKG